MKNNDILCNNCNSYNNSIQYDERHIMKSDIIKIILSIVVGGGGSYWKMEDRVSKLEGYIEVQKRKELIQYEIREMKRLEEWRELKHKMKLDSITRKYD